MNDLVVGAASIGDNRCAWSGEVHGSVYVVGTVASKALDFERYGPSGRLPYGWADVADTPDSELVVWVSFSAPMFQ